MEDVYLSIVNCLWENVTARLVEEAIANLKKRKIIYNGEGGSKA